MQNVIRLQAARCSIKWTYSIQFSSSGPLVARGQSPCFSDFVNRGILEYYMKVACVLRNEIGFWLISEKAKLRWRPHVFVAERKSKCLANRASSQQGFLYHFGILILVSE
jgi:hypothetical protein